MGGAINFVSVKTQASLDTKTHWLCQKRLFIQNTVTRYPYLVRFYSFYISPFSIWWIGMKWKAKIPSGTLLR